MALNWWILFRWHTQSEWNFFLFLFILLSPTVEFLLAVLLFPEPLEHGTDFKQHFYSNHRWFFVLAALLPPLDAADTLLKGYALHSGWRMRPEPILHAHISRAERLVAIARETEAGQIIDELHRAAPQVLRRGTCPI